MNSPVNDTITNTELFTLASQLYVRLRRNTGRVVDAVYMVQNEDYAREILRIAAKERDVELLSIVTRFETLLARQQARRLGATARQGTNKAPVDIPVLEPINDKSGATVRPLPVMVTSHTHEEEVAHHYIGALR